MKDSTRRLLTGLLGVLVGALVGSAVGATITSAYGFHEAYAQGISMAFIAPAVMFTTLARRDFGREEYYEQRGRGGIAFDGLLVGALGLAGGLVGAYVAVSMGLGETLTALLPFVLGMLAGAAAFVGRNGEFYERSVF